MLDAGATEHLEKVAQFIATLEADVVNLVEVEGCSNLKSLVVYGGAAALDGAYTAYLRQGTDSATGQDVALVTRCVIYPLFLVCMHERVGGCIKYSSCPHSAARSNLFFLSLLSDICARRTLCKHSPRDSDGVL